MISRETVSQPLLRRLGSGLVSGFAVTVLFSAVAVVTWLANDRSFGVPGVDLRLVLGTYAISGPLMGLLVGALFPLAKWAAGAFVLGAISASLLFSLFGPALGFELMHYIVAAGYGVLIGGFTGRAVHRRVSLGGAASHQEPEAT